MGKWLLIDRAPGGAPTIAKKRLVSALEQWGADLETRSTWTGAFTGNTVIIGLNTDPIIYNLVDEVATAPESLQMFRAGGAGSAGRASGVGNVGSARDVGGASDVGGAAVLSGSDARGLAYAVMEMAERVVERGEAALLELEPETKAPSVAVRGIDKLICNTGDCDWWMSEDYWRYRLEGMLRARFNRLTFLVGFDTSYLSPPYPYFVDVPEFPGVRVEDPGVDRAQYRAALRRLGSLAHEYGMDFTFATWQQTNWLSSQKSKVVGIEDLMLYCSAGIRELAVQCPEIDTIQLRVNHEAGVGTQVTAEEYWFKQLDGLAEAVARGSTVKLEMRAKGLTDPMIRYAKELGLDLTVSTKYWCEQAGLPHHLTRMRTEELTRLDNLNHSRRYSYSDMLKKPRLHRFMYRLWSNGSNDLFTWGDPDYVRRFVASMALGHADGFEIIPMLALKGGPEDGKDAGWNIFDDPAYQPEGYEDSRYWLNDRLFGRIGYDAGERDEAWMRPMRQIYGGAAEPMMAAIASASRVLPFIVGYHMPVHPQLAYWAEFSTGGALFAEHNYNPSIKRAGVTYQSTEPGDAGLFYPIDEYAKDCAAGKEDGRYTPWQVAGALRDMSANALKYLAEAEGAGLPASSEARGAALDVRMLSELALYHRYKIAAATYLCLYMESGGERRLGLSLEMMQLARDKWASFAELGQKYHHRLVFYVGNYSVCRVGNWKDFAPEHDADVARLAKMLSEAGAAHVDNNKSAAPTGENAGAAPTDENTDTSARAADECGTIPAANICQPAWHDDVPKSCAAGEPLRVTLKTAGKDAFRGGVNIRYRHTNQLEGAFVRHPMELSGGAWRAEIPAEYITPEWDLMVYFEAVGADGAGKIYPGIWNSEHMLPYHLVTVK